MNGRISLNESNANDFFSKPLNNKADPLKSLLEFSDFGPNRSLAGFLFINSRVKFLKTVGDYEGI